MSGMRSNPAVDPQQAMPRGLLPSSGLAMSPRGHHQSTGLMLLAGWDVGLHYAQQAPDHLSTLT